MRVIHQNNQRINAESDVKKRVYVADNNPVFRDLLKLVLEQKGYSVRIFEDGYYLIKALRINKTANIELPELIICDVNMRVMGGLDLFNEVRGSGLYPEAIPFIFLTECHEEEALIVSAKKSRSEVYNKSELLRPIIEAIHRVLPPSTINQTIQ